MTQDLPELGWTVGTEATVVFVEDHPSLAYESEQTDRDSYAIFLGTIEPQFAERIGSVEDKSWHLPGP